MNSLIIVHKHGDLDVFDSWLLIITIFRPSKKNPPSERAKFTIHTKDRPCVCARWLFKLFWHSFISWSGGACFALFVGKTPMSRVESRADVEQQSRGFYDDFKSASKFEFVSFNVLKICSHVTRGEGENHHWTKLGREIKILIKTHSNIFLFCLYRNTLFLLSSPFMCTTSTTRGAFEIEFICP